MFMEVIKINQKINFLFILVLSLTLAGSAAFGQAKIDSVYAIKQQPYGDSTLVDFDVEMEEDGMVYLTIYPDDDLLDIITVVFDKRNNPDHHDKQIISRVSTYGDKPIVIPFDETQDVFCFNRQGVTTIGFVRTKGSQESGLFLLNGQVTGVLSSEGVTGDVSGLDIHAFKNTVWGWSESRLDY
jgi:hypothetical protein